MIIQISPDDVARAARKAREHSRPPDALTRIWFVKGIEAVLGEILMLTAEARKPIQDAIADAAEDAHAVTQQMIRAEKARAAAAKPPEAA